MEPIGPTHLSKPSHVPTHTALDGNAVEEYLIANEAMGRVGAALVGHAPDEPNLKTAIQDTMARLQNLAQEAGVDLSEVQK